MSIIKVKNGYRLVSKSTGRNLGTFSTLAQAKKRERQVQFFKNVKKSKGGKRGLRARVRKKPILARRKFKVLHRS